MLGANVQVRYGGVKQWHQVGGFRDQARVALCAVPHTGCATDWPGLPLMLLTGAGRAGRCGCGSLPLLLAAKGLRRCVSTVTHFTVRAIRFPPRRSPQAE